MATAQSPARSAGVVTRCWMCGKRARDGKLCRRCDEEYNEARQDAWETQTRFTPGTAIKAYHGETGRDDI